jgi:GT2 family glycosyltransferase
MSIVILSYNRLADLQLTVQSLISDLSPDIELIVVDNASTDGSREFLQNINFERPELITILRDSNGGPPAGRNAGLRVSQGKYIVCLDDDAFMPFADIRKVPYYFSKHTNAGILAFKVCHSKTGKLQNDYGDSIVAIGNFHGAGFAVRQDLFGKIGYLDELCTFGAEEFDFSLRCHAAGFQTLFVPELVVKHNSYCRPGSVGADRHIKWVYNFVRVIFKHFPRHISYVYAMRYFIMASIWGFRNHGPRIVMSSIGSAWRGRRDGILVFCVLPPKTVQFYKNPQLRPEFGNSPLHVFLIRVIRYIIRQIRSGHSCELHKDIL